MQLLPQEPGVTLVLLQLWGYPGVCAGGFRAGPTVGRAKAGLTESFLLGRVSHLLTQCL